MPYDDPAKGLAESLPGMSLVKRAGQGGELMLQLLQRTLGKGAAPDDLARRRGQMSEPEYRQWLQQQRDIGQQAQPQPFQVPPSK